MEEQEGHHRPGVVQLEVVRRVDPHRALDMVAAQVQVSHAVLFAHHHFGPGFRAPPPLHRVAILQSFSLMPAV